MDEHVFIQSLTQNFPRCPTQINKSYESDSELVQIKENNPLLAISTDSIVEEIETGLYSDPYLLGWMTVTVNASDLAAVGARPMGILLNQTFPKDPDPAFLKGLQKGIHEASCQYALPVLGGDCNFSKHPQMSATAIGIASQTPLTRLGVKAGDILASTGPCGIGNIFAFSKLFMKEDTKFYRPQARLQEGQELCSQASACMDSSDGLLSTLEELGRLNNVGFHLQAPYSKLVHSQIKQYPQLNPFLCLAGHHGDFELIFTMPETKWQNTKNFHFLGKVTSNPGIQIHEQMFIPPGNIQKCWQESKGNLSLYLDLLNQLEATCC